MKNSLKTIKINFELNINTLQSSCYYFTLIFLIINPLCSVQLDNGHIILKLINQLPVSAVTKLLLSPMSAESCRKCVCESRLWVAGGDGGCAAAPRIRAVQRRDAAVMAGRYVVVAGVAAACYANALYGEFVHDDVVAVVHNPDVLGTQPITALLTDDFWGTPLADPRSHKSYRPLTTLTFR